MWYPRIWIALWESDAKQPDSNKTNSTSVSSVATFPRAPAASYWDSSLQLFYDVVAQSTVALTAATQIEKTDFMAAARFELAVHVNVCQPDSQQNKNPNPRQPDATRNKAAILIVALAALIEEEWICLQSAKGVRMAMNGGGFAYLSYLSCKADCVEAQALFLMRQAFVRSAWRDTSLLQISSALHRYGSHSTLLHPPATKGTPSGPNSKLMIFYSNSR